MSSQGEAAHFSAAMRGPTAFIKEWRNSRPTARPPRPTIISLPGGSIDEPFYTVQVPKTQPFLPELRASVPLSAGVIGVPSWNLTPERSRKLALFASSANSKQGVVDCAEEIVRGRPTVVLLRVEPAGRDVGVPREHHAAASVTPGRVDDAHRRRRERARRQRSPQQGAPRQYRLRRSLLPEKGKAEENGAPVRRRPCRQASAGAASTGAPQPSTFPDASF